MANLFLFDAFYSATFQKVCFYFIIKLLHLEVPTSFVPFSFTDFLLPPFQTGSISNAIHAFKNALLAIEASPLSIWNAELHLSHLRAKISKITLARKLLECEQERVALSQFSPFRKFKLIFSINMELHYAREFNIIDRPRKIKTR